MIDNAIRDNRAWEALCFVLVIVFASVGVFVIACGVYQGNGLIALSGAVAAALFWPALNNAAAIRRENIAIRLLEVPLSEAKTSKQAAEAIRDAFSSIFARGKSHDPPKT